MFKTRRKFREYIMELETRIADLETQLEAAKSVAKASQAAYHGSLETLLKEKADLKQDNIALHNVIKSDQDKLDKLKKRVKTQQNIIDKLNLRLAQKVAYDADREDGMGKFPEE